MTTSGRRLMKKYLGVDCRVCDDTEVDRRRRSCSVEPHDAGDAAFYWLKQFSCLAKMCEGRFGARILKRLGTSELITCHSLF